MTTEIVGYLGGSMVLYRVDVSEEQFAALVEKTETAAQSASDVGDEYDEVNETVPPWEIIARTSDGGYLLGTPHPAWLKSAVEDRND